MILLLAVLLQAGPFEDGLRAFREGRFQEAATLLEEANEASPTYDGLITLGLALGRLERYAEAGAAFSRAISLAPERPEAWTERGGLRFLEKHYREASSDLEVALRIRDDTYGRGLLAASLFLSGRTDEALEEWNRLGEPKLRNLSITGLVTTRDQVARREISLAEGALLDLSELRASSRRLSEVGVFDRVTLRPIPQGDGTADLEVALAERHGFGSLLGLALGTGVNAFSGRVRLGYANIDGEGASTFAQYRWQSTRPEFSLALDWPRPLGAGVYLHLRGFLGRQDFLLDGSFREKGGGGDVVARRVLNGRSVFEAALRLRHRTFSVSRPYAAPGGILGLEAGLETAFKESSSERLVASAHVLGASLSSQGGYARFFGTLKYRLNLSPPEGFALERSVLAVQFQGGVAGATMPIDQQFAPGGSPDMELPLRAHPQDRDGALGAAPLGRSLVLANLEWRRRLVHTAFLSGGLVLFYDAGRIAKAIPAPTTFHDVGLGLRFTLPGAPIVRVDYGRGLTDGAHAVFFGLGEVF